MRADRLLSIVLLLQSHSRLSAGNLAERLEVSERTILRDMDALSTAGIPVYAERGKGGGWSLLESYRANLHGLHLQEIQTLFLSHPTPVLEDLGLAETTQLALLKILAALPRHYQASAEFIRERIHIDLAGWHSSKEDISHLPTLQAALWQECCVQMIYLRGDGTTVERKVEPWGLVAKGSIWYLVAGVEDEPRTYRISRIQQISLLSEHAARPTDFNLAGYWTQSKQEFVNNLPSYFCQLRVHPDMQARVQMGERFVHIRAVSPPDADGWVQMDIQADVEEEACRFVLGFGAMVEVLAPPELRARVIQAAQALIEYYQGSSISNTQGPFT